MSERKIDVDLTKGSENITPVETRASKKARMAQVYERGVVGDRLHVELPLDLHGEWVPNNSVDVHRKEALGFRIDTEFAKQRALHDKGDAASYVGDCVFMICAREDKEIIDEIRKENYIKTHAPRGGKQKEERDFITQAAPETSPSAESTAKTARKTEITAAIVAANNQT